MTSRQYLSLSTKMGTIKGLLSWCRHRIIIILALVMVRYVGKLVWGKYIRMCGATWANTWVFG